MAIFPELDAKLFACKECNCNLFEEVEIKSYITDDIKVKENTNNVALKCIQCGAYHNINDDYEIVKSI